MVKKRFSSTVLSLGLLLWSVFFISCGGGSSEKSSTGPSISVEGFAINANNQSRVPISGTCNKSGEAITFSYKVGEGEYQDIKPASPVTCNGTSFSTTLDFSGVTGDTAKISFKASFAGTSSGEKEAIKDLVAPTAVALTKPVANAYVNIANQNSFKVTGTCSETNGFVTFSHGTAVGRITCDGTSFSGAVDLSASSIGEGDISFKAILSDIAGNTLESRAVSIKKDTVAPSVAFSKPTANAFVNIANEDSFSVEGTCSEASQGVSLSPGTVASTITCDGTNFSGTVDLSDDGIGEGEISFTATLTDAAGNSTSSTVSITKSTAPPTAPVLTGLSDGDDVTISNAGSFSVSGTCNAPNGVVTFSHGTSSSAVSCNGSSFTGTVDLSGVDVYPGAEIAFTATLTDAAGNSSEESSAVTLDYVACGSSKFVLVPPLTGYTENDFCLMKYEAKNDGNGNVLSQAAGRPWTNINRQTAVGKCEALGDGYDLITNDEWQTVARNIEGVASNWATGTVGNAGGLNRGHSDDTPNQSLAASANDNEGCSGTGQTCDGSTWNVQRRTNTLSNGEVIWDIAGNAWEWVKDTYSNGSNYGPNKYISQITDSTHSAARSLSGGLTTTARRAKAQFGPSGNYSSFGAPFGHLGYGYLNSRAGGVNRGGGWAARGGSGVFTVDLSQAAGTPRNWIGFRCVFRP